MSFEEADIEVEEAEIILLSIVPDHSSPENILEISTFATLLPSTDLDITARYVLLDRSNCDKSLNQYSLEADVNLSKYSIANYMSTHKLFEFLKVFLHNVSSADIPNRMHAALMDPN